jgi:hypothetical protein
MHPLLTVVVPTINRPSELNQTLSSIAHNYPLDPNVARFFVFDNGSNPPAAIDEDVLSLFRGNISLFRVDSTLPSRDSFARCVSFADCGHIQVFGDDDIALGHLGYFICDVLSEHDGLSLLYLNRLIGNHDLSDVSEIAHAGICSSRLLCFDASSFIQSYTHWPGFISSLVFSLDMWATGIAASYASGDRYLGYEHLDIVYRGCASKYVFVLGYPLLIQRRGLQYWKAYWPLFWLQSMRRILSDLDSDCVTKSSLDVWMRTEIKPINLLADLLICSANPAIYESKFWNELCSVFGRYPRFVPFLLIRFMPAPLSRFLLSLSPNSSKYFLDTGSSATG